jgi:transcriptional regulator with XRE-family HTH domain
MPLGNNLRKARKKRGLTQSEVGNLLGVTEQTISGYERGVRDPDTQQLSRLAQIYGVSTDYLLGRPPVIINTPGQPPGSINAGGFERILADMPDGPERETLAALADEPALFEFWQEMLKREDLQLLFKQTRPLSPDAIKRVIRYIKMVEDEEAKQD